MQNHTFYGQTQIWLPNANNNMGNQSLKKTTPVQSIYAHLTLQDSVETQSLSSLQLQTTAENLSVK